jgi:hypothetical protein
VRSGLRGRVFLAWALVGSLAAGAVPLRATASEERAVHDAFTSLVAALAARDGDATWAHLSGATRVEWARDCEVALHGNVDTVQALPPGPRLLVLALRHGAPAWARTSGTPRELADRAVHAGLVDGRAAHAVDLADVAVQGDRASGVLFVSGLPSPFRAAFVREDAAWKLDLPGTLALAGRVLTRAARSNGTDESAVIVNLLAAVSGRPVGVEAWRPLVPAARAAPHLQAGKPSR